MVAVQQRSRPTTFVDRRLTRQQFIRRGATLAGGIVGLQVLGRSPASAHGQSDESRRPGRRDGAPKPIPGGFDANFNTVPIDPLVHVLPPAIGFEMSTITDFNGVVAATEVRGTARGSDGSQYWFDADMRIMDGEYVDENGRHREHAFGFI